MTKEEDIKRCELLGIPTQEEDSHHWAGGTFHFDSVSAETMQELVDLGFARPQECQNDSPSIQRFMEFCKEESTDNCSFYMHGYVVSTDRSDCRITVDGIEADGYMTREQELDFIKEFRMAGEFDIESGYCWYD